MCAESRPAPVTRPPTGVTPGEGSGCGAFQDGLEGGYDEVGRIGRSWARPPVRRQQPGRWGGRRGFGAPPGRCPEVTGVRVRDVAEESAVRPTFGGPHDSHR